MTLLHDVTGDVPAWCHRWRYCMTLLHDVTDDVTAWRHWWRYWMTSMHDATAWRHWWRYCVTSLMALLKRCLICWSPRHDLNYSSQCRLIAKYLRQFDAISFLIDGLSGACAGPSRDVIGRSGGNLAAKNSASRLGDILSTSTEEIWKFSFVATVLNHTTT